MTRTFPITGRCVRALSGSSPFGILCNIRNCIISSLARVTIGTGSRALSSACVIFSVRAAKFDSVHSEVVRVKTIGIRGKRVMSGFDAFIGPRHPVPFRVAGLADVASRVILSTPAVRIILPRFLRFVNRNTLITRGTKFSIKFVRRGYHILNLRRRFASISAITLTHILLPALSGCGLGLITGTLKVSLRGRRHTISSTNTATRVFMGFIRVLGSRRVVGLGRVGGFKSHGIGTVHGVPARRVVLVTRGSVKECGLCRLVATSRVACCTEEPEVPGDLVGRRERKVVVKDTYRTKRLCHTILRGRSSRRVTELTSFCSCCRVRPVKGSVFVLRSRGAPGVGARRSLHGMGQRVIRLKRGFNGPIMTAYSIRFLSPRSRICHQVVVTKGKFGSTSGRTPLFLHAASRVLRRFTCLNSTGTERIIVRGPRGVTHVMRGVSPMGPGGYPPMVTSSSRRLQSVYCHGTRRVCKRSLPMRISSELRGRLGSVVSGKCTIVCVVTRGLM